MFFKRVNPKGDSGEIPENRVQESPKLEFPAQLYKVPSDFIDEMLDNLVISDGALKRCQLSLTSVDKLLDSL